MDAEVLDYACALQREYDSTPLMVDPEPYERCKTALEKLVRELNEDDEKVSELTRMRDAMRNEELSTLFGDRELVTTAARFLRYPVFDMFHEDFARSLDIYENQLYCVVELFCSFVVSDRTGPLWRDVAEQRRKNATCYRPNLLTFADLVRYSLDDPSDPDGDEVQAVVKRFIFAGRRIAAAFDFFCHTAGRFDSISVRIRDTFVPLSEWMDAGGHSPQTRAVFNNAFGALLGELSWGYFYQHELTKDLAAPPLLKALRVHLTRTLHNRALGRERRATIRRPPPAAGTRP